MLDAEPFGDERIDLGFARLACLYIAAHQREGAEAPKFSEHITDFWADGEGAEGEMPPVPDQKLLEAKIDATMTAMGVWKPPQLRDE